MQLRFVILAFLVALACPFVGYAQYDIVMGSIREGPKWLVQLASHPSVRKTALVHLSQDFRVLKVEVRKN
jgi:hypothetical protein